MNEIFAADWLALRVPADSAARSAELAHRFLSVLPAGAPVLDLGAGAGANAGYLAALDTRPRPWRLVDADAGLLGAAPDLPGGVDRRVARLSAGALGPLLDGVAGVTASAFLDIVSADWIAAFAAAAADRGLPVLIALTVDGRIKLAPEDAADSRVLARFAADQSRDKGFGPAAGGMATDLLARALSAHGYAVALRRSDWHLGGPADALTAAYLQGLALDADRDDGVAGWLERRLAAAAAGRLRIEVGHLDLLGWSGSPSSKI